MDKGVFKFHVISLSYGWCKVVMIINNKEISFNASYIGDNPLASFIDACMCLKEKWDEYHIVWEDEPGTLKIDLKLGEKDMLHFDITASDMWDEDESVEKEWHEVVPFNAFEDAIISEGFRVLNAFGLYGYRFAWLNDEDFPITNLLHISSESEELGEDGSFITDISKEINTIQKHISNMRITKETKMDDCTVYYDSWQIQCCGDPFSVGDMIEWTCIAPSLSKNAHGRIIDFDEEHHGSVTHTITGTVSKIIVERSEFPKGKRETNYVKAETKYEEIHHADGWESEIEDDDTTERTFWGYIVELKDVIVKPLKYDKQS